VFLGDMKAVRARVPGGDEACKPHAVSAPDRMRPSKQMLRAARGARGIKPLFPAGVALLHHAVLHGFYRENTGIWA
jgi:hypothetical protein